MRIANWLRAVSLCLIVFGVVLASAQIQANTPSGTVITNQAEVSWFDTATGTVKNAFSNVSSVVVADQYDLLLEQDIVRHSAVGKKVDLPHRLTNTGNTSSEYEVRIRHNLGDSGNLEALKVFTDSNANGVTEPGEPEWAAISCNPLEVNVSCYRAGSLDPNELHEFVVSGNTSTAAQTGDIYSMTIRAFPWKYDKILSSAGPDEITRSSPEFVSDIAVTELSDDWVNNDLVDIIEGAVLTVTKIATPGCGVPVRAGQVITYQIGFSNIGGAAPVGKSLLIDGVDITGVVLEDVLPANLTLNKSTTPVSTPNQSVVLVQKVEDEDTGRWITFSSWNGTDVVSKIGLFVPTSQIQPNQSGFLTNVALVHDQNNKVIKTGLPITPQVGPSGLWSSPTDLAKITIEIQNALRNKNNNVISNSIAKKVMKVTALKDAVGGWSYGGQRSFGFNNYDWVRIGGSNTGVGGDVYATMTDGNGFAFLANGEKPNRSPVIGNTTVKLLKIMDWNKKLDEEIVEIPANIKEKLIGTYNDFLHRPFSVEILEKDNKLYASTPFFEFFGGKKKNEMMYLKNGLFRIKNYPNLLKFNMINGNPNSVTLIRDNITAEVKLIKK